MTGQNAVKRWGPTAVANALGIPSITDKINARRSTIESAAREVWGDELAARRARKGA
jgi:hypothetical protein